MIIRKGLCGRPGKRRWLLGLKWWWWWEWNTYNKKPDSFIVILAFICTFIYSTTDIKSHYVKTEDLKMKIHFSLSINRFPLRGKQPGKQL